ncbi:hypothetical protein [Streptococcus uberis]|uniref:hypothetical protein n=1 Tax=Streptococcus uberis TaxID=1349 RepID=UPI0019397B35|nr:hypothetical protein [Streptococcus uberis]
MIIDESAFFAWNPMTGKTVLEKKISYYDGVITNFKIEKFFQKPASIEFMSIKLGNRLTEF